MVTTGLMVRLEAKPGKEAAVEAFLRDGLKLLQVERGTSASFALRTGPRTFTVFDVFSTEAERDAHLAGPLEKEIAAKVPEYFSGPPAIERFSVLASNLPCGMEIADSLG
jgi:quinol monooxygenase YgiN